jgi:hypothetical protein
MLSGVLIQDLRYHRKRCLLPAGCAVRKVSIENFAWPRTDLATTSHFCIPLI